MSYPYGVPARENEMYWRDGKVYMHGQEIRKSNAPSGSTNATGTRNDRGLDAEARLYRQQYQSFRKTARPLGLRDFINEPGMYDGEPRESMAWHDRGAAMAQHSRNVYEGVVDARRNMANDYIGYDLQKGRRGHKNRIESSESSARHMLRKETLHRTTHGRRP
ncbi:predicted protein [Uncinocarpus reesii 1704]|uniref:Uncharacterized protein n=1 Tax=Uncinocarpus reesii (strain UAMH 1704) TaxID=336963 RepID=C4JMB5_UNCRE|nr:uncharacterized protein UREG_03973 [Uncinocarpus reesii 1704]EEP79127.1 predicted protein [Uncinocarpus reesii 1704]